MIDNEGYRANVGIVLTNDKQQILLAKRYQQDAWQLPQGGIDKNETEIEALFRELDEEVGLSSKHVEVIAKTPKWLRYDLPEHHIRRRQKPLCVGQKQVWFLLKLTCDESNIKLDTHSDIEFDDWEWVDYWHPIEQVIDFKKPIYEDMLKALAPILFNNQHSIPPQYSRPLKCSAIALAE
ncbi:RNA pyrophosphohydrolase [Candidatus Thioglobus sp.]|jgi:putative (di)nucleoside polyphosphate hydrolase|uniref:RNA pyrophosphohydrolase n=1 Tax=Candidatus Thioglobus sp. TaxID=2026721 RepID=UPI001EC71DCD|nr:RNA pyrophosphohydrolase [Candidatus Thioglobus sp.]MBT3187010.1 RNA pyrophosphohydrolase [Candidatus Thioglobus sp.]MBT5784098.1 RNA pyrophosphohydrolase [Candidatus Thioglobus sp.]